MYYLVLIHEKKSAALGGVFCTLDQAVVVGDEAASNDYKIIRDFSELNVEQQLSIYNSIVKKHPHLGLDKAVDFASKVEANDRITHSLGKLTDDEMNAFTAAKKKTRKPRDVVGYITLSTSANSDDKIWRKASLRVNALRWIKDKCEASGGQVVALSEAIHGIAEENSITHAQVRGLLDKLRGVNAIKVIK
jgi:hypothetical protein